jgi:hypothetical protein
VIPEILNEHKTFSRIGSFWSSVASADTRAKARRIVESVEQNAGMSTIDREAVRLTDNAGIRGAHLDIQVPAETVTRETGTPYNVWRMPITDAIIPLALDTKLGKRVLGNDYSFSNGVLTFRESVYALFEFPRVHVSAYQEVLFNTHNYALWLETPVQNLQEVALYCRDNQTTAQFQKAIAVAAGYVVLPFSGVLQARVGNTYVFDTGIVDVVYQHTPLTVGYTYSAGTVVGGVVRVYASDGVDLTWYQRLDWQSGLPLASLCPFSGLSVADVNVTVTRGAESTAHAGKYHVSAPLIGDSGVAAKFWVHQAACEDRSNKFMNDALGLTGGSPTASVNLIDFWFSYMLAARGVIIDLPVYPDSADYHARAARFIAREAPAGSIPIIRYP